uniref:Uncharacterized protein n=1 Tax=Alexandrium monilatum TaxID=311494 RepID=A0A7S4QFH7_9DINO
MEPAAAPPAPLQLRRCAAANGRSARGCAPSHRRARPIGALALLAAGAAAASGLLGVEAFVALPPGRAAPPRRGAARVAAAASPPARTAAEEQEIADRLDDVLRERLSKKDGQTRGEGETQGELSPWAQRAADAASGAPKVEKKAAKKKKAGGGAAKKKKQEKSKKIVKKSLDEVLKAASDDSDRPNYLPARRDVYKEVGITQAEVEAYWERRDESSQSFIDKFLFLAYPIAFFAAVAIGFSVYDSTVNPQTEYTASMTGTG